MAKAERILGYDIEIVPPQEDHAFARVILDSWSDDLADEFTAHPHEGSLREDVGEPSMFRWEPGGYFGYGFQFIKGNVYVAIGIPSGELSLIATDPEQRERYEAKIRDAWKRIAEDTWREAAAIKES